MNKNKAHAKRNKQIKTRREDHVMSKGARGMKSRLDAYVCLRRELELQTLRLQQMREDMGDIKSPNFEPHASGIGAGSDGVSRDVQRLMKLEATVEDLSKREYEEAVALERIVQRMDNAEHRFIIRGRYFDLLSWKDIAFMLYGDVDRDFVAKEETYVKLLYAKNQRALETMARAQSKMVSLTNPL